MFTGIVEEAGKVLSLEKLPNGVTRFAVQTQTIHQDIKVGDSVACNGCCLTVVACHENTLSFDLLEQTMKVTNLKALGEGKRINLERSMPADGRFGGHFVSGHIDDVGEIIKLEPQGSDYLVQVKVPSTYQRYLVSRGSIAVDGISLTVAEVQGDVFTLWIIPHTWSVTALQERKAGDYVNLEFDLIAKYLEKLSIQR